MKLKAPKTVAFQESKFKKGMITCPVCSNKHQYHCSVTEDGGLAICKYVPSDKQAKDGRYEHILNNGIEKFPPVISNKIELNVAERADSDKLNKVYSALLKGLKLNPNHSDQLLLNRGLSDSAIERNFYASVPNRNDGLKIGSILSKNIDLKGVPGFYTQSGAWCLNTNYSGFYIPYRDEKGRIIGLQIRKDLDDGQKYLWVSSSSKENGCSSGSPLHFVNPAIVEQTNEIFITEGALKADVIGDILDVGVIAMAGVNAMSAENLKENVFEAFPNLQKINLAFDMDWQAKDEVRDALLKLLRVLEKKPVSLMIATWDINLGKGLDDVLFKAQSEDLDDTVLIEYVKAEDFLEQLKIDDSKIEDENYIEVKTDQIKTSEPLIQDFVANDEKEKFNLDTPKQDLKRNSALGYTWRDFSNLKLEKPEKVITGLCRGNVGQLVASTNIGKTTLILNLAISASSDKHFKPLFNEETVERRIMYIDGEATKSELQADLFKMLESCSLEEQKKVKDNLFLVCDEEINDEPLDLVLHEHQEEILKQALLFKPDLIVIDTLSALANLEDENDNAKVKKEIIQPLKTLAKKTNSAVLMLHHTGKYNEGSPQATDAYKGRGASALGALCRTVFNLKEQKGKIVLSCSKIKGEKFQDTDLKLDQNLRWFKVMENTVIEPIGNYQKVIDFVKSAGNPVKREEILNSLKMEDATLTRHLGYAVKNGDLIKPKYGYYSVPESINPKQELPLNE